MEHRAFLVECGVPHEVADSDRSWIYVLLHGDDGLQTGWDPTWMTKKQAQRLLCLVESEVQCGLLYGLLRRLRQRVDD